MNDAAILALILLAVISFMIGYSVGYEWRWDDEHKEEK